MSDGEAKQTPKEVNYDRIPDSLENETHPVRAMIVSLIKTNDARFGHLANTRIGLCWQLNCKPGPDGLVAYGKAVILSDFQKEFMQVKGGQNPICFDVIVVINKEWWTQEATAEGGKRTTDDMRRGLLIHLLLQVQKRVGVDGEQKVDVRNRRLYRKAQPNVAVFAEEIRDGAWNEAQQDAYRRVLEFADTLFDNISPVKDDMKPEVAGSVGPANDVGETKPAAAPAAQPAAAAG